MRSKFLDFSPVHLAVVSALTGATLAVPAYAALQGRDVDKDASNGFEAYYDTVLDITWLADANYAKTSGAYADAFPTGGMWWDFAVTWTQNLNYFGATDWRLPKVISKISSGTLADVSAGRGAAALESELGYMYYTHLRLGDNPTPSSGTIALSGVPDGYIKNFVADLYWTSDRFAGNQSLAWGLWTSYPFAGSQAYVPRVLPEYAWAVHDGDPFGVKVVVPDTPPLPAVDEPSSAMLLLVGLGVAAHMLRQRKGFKRSSNALA